MSTKLLKLVLVCPAELGDAMAETLLDHQPALPGFTTFTADGHGLTFETASMAERVRGRVERRVFWLVLKADDVPALIEWLSSRIRHPQLIHWTEPVLDFGHLS